MRSVLYRVFHRLTQLACYHKNELYMQTSKAKVKFCPDCGKILKEEKIDDKEVHTDI